MATEAIDPAAWPFVQRIRAAYPDLAIRSAVLGGGQNTDVLSVTGPADETLIFRFPKYAGGVRGLAAEAELLDAIRGRLPLPVPAPIYGSFSRLEPGHCFTGHPRLPGEPLSRQAFAAIPDEADLQRLADQLSGFLRALHSLPLTAVPVGLLRPDPGRAGVEAMYRRVQEQLFPAMTLDARAAIDTHFEGFLSATAADYTPVLVHHDFGSSNILYDPDSLNISGIIDFAEAMLGDPAYDLAGLLASYGEGFVLRLGSVYPGLEALLPRARFYAGTFALEEALFGLDNGDEGAFHSGMTGAQRVPAEGSTLGQR